MSSFCSGSVLRFLYVDVIACRFTRFAPACTGGGGTRARPTSLVWLLLRRPAQPSTTRGKISSSRGLRAFTCNSNAPWLCYSSRLLKAAVAINQRPQDEALKACMVLEIVLAYEHHCLNQTKAFRSHDLLRAPLMNNLLCQSRILTASCSEYLRRCSRTPRALI